MTSSLTSSASGSGRDRQHAELVKDRLKRPHSSHQTRRKPPDVKHENAFYITSTTKMRINFADRRAFISCKTKDGKTVDLEADLKTLEKINAEVRKRPDML